MQAADQEDMVRNSHTVLCFLVFITLLRTFQDFTYKFSPLTVIIGDRVDTCKIYIYYLFQ